MNPGMVYLCGIIVVSIFLAIYFGFVDSDLGKIEMLLMTAFLSLIWPLYIVIIPGLGFLLLLNYFGKKLKEKLYE